MYLPKLKYLNIINVENLLKFRNTNELYAKKGFVNL